MSEPTRPEPSDDEDVRRHAQDPAEGTDEDADTGEDVPRVHPQEPAEG